MSHVVDTPPISIPPFLTVIEPLFLAGHKASQTYGSFSQTLVAKTCSHVLANGLRVGS